MSSIMGKILQEHVKPQKPNPTRLGLKLTIRWTKSLLQDPGFGPEQTVCGKKENWDFYMWITSCLLLQWLLDSQHYGIGLNKCHIPTHRNSGMVALTSVYLDFQQWKNLSFLAVEAIKIYVHIL